MARQKNANDYSTEAKKLLAWWQEALHTQLRDPELLNAWFSSLREAYSPPHASTHAASSTQSANANAAVHELARELTNLRRELASLRTRLAKLERSVANKSASKSAKSSRKPATTKRKR